MVAASTLSSEADRAGNGGPVPYSDRLFAAVGTLRLLLIATIVVPLLLGTGAGYLSYQHNYEQAVSSASEAVAFAAENTTKLLDMQRLVAVRVNDLLGSITDDQVRSLEKSLHEQIAQQIADMPQVVAAWVIGANGRGLVSGRVYPVDRDLDQSDRDDLRTFRNSDARTLFWVLYARSLDSQEYRPFFTVSLRRTGLGGRFNGIVVVSVPGSYFASFYNALLAGLTHYTVDLLESDGTVLAKYPAPTGPSAPQLPDPLLAKAVANEAATGIAESGTPFDGAGRLVAVRRVANYPIYVTVERTKASILHEWLQSIAGYIVICVPAAIILIALSVLALRRTRREQLAHARASMALERNAALEVQLHRAQRFETVGLLTAGLMHDFNSLLTVIRENVEHLETTIEHPDPKLQRIVAAVQDGCDRASMLTKQLMGFALREPIRPRPISVNDLIVNTLELPWHSGGRITGDIRLHRELWPVCVDPDQLATVLLNLVFNASDALTEGEKLIVETTNSSFGGGDTVENADAPKGDFVGIFVRNTGHQLPPEVGKTAFDPFLGAKQSGKGAWLMLSLVHAFAMRSGGHCIIEGEPERGTTIRLYLPRHRSDQEMKPEAAEATTRYTGPIWVAPTIRKDPVGP